MQELNVKKITKKTRLLSTISIYLSVLSSIIAIVIWIILGFSGTFEPGSTVDGVVEKKTTIWPVFIIILFILLAAYTMIVRRYIYLYTVLLSKETVKSKRYHLFKSMSRRYRFYSVIAWYIVEKYNFIVEAKKNLWLFREEEIYWINTN